MDFEPGGWLSGSCGAGGEGEGWRLPWMESTNPAAVDGAGSAVDDPWTAATQWWLTEGHLPSRPGWDCRECQAAWPCPLAQAALAGALSRRALAVVMSEWMYLAAGELRAVMPGAMFDRFLLWTRRL